MPPTGGSGPSAVPPAALPVAGDPFVRTGLGGVGIGGGTSGLSGGSGAAAIDTPPATALAINYQIILETFDLSRNDLTVLLDGPGDDTARYQRLVEWTKTSQAILTSFSAHTTHSGTRSVAESIHEVRYAMEFAQPAAEEDYAYPTTFETRNTGDTFEEELSVEPDGKQANIAVALHTVRLQGFRDHLASVGRATSATSTPIFSTRALNTNVNLSGDHPRLLGTFTNAAEDTTQSDTVRVAFIRVRPAVTGAPTGEPAVGPVSLRLEYSFFSLERSAARALVLANADPQKCHDALRRLCQENQAHLDHASLNVTTPGNRTVIEEIVETRYPTEFNTPRFPGQTDSADVPAPAPDPKKSLLSAGTSVAVRSLVQNPLPPGSYPKKALVPATADSYETRNTGFTAEAEPNLDADGIHVDMQLVPQFVRHLGSLEVTGVAKEYPAQPLFETRKFSGNVSGLIGQQQFLSTYNHPGSTGANGSKDDGLVVLGFVRVVPVK